MKQKPSEERNDLALLAIQRVLEAERSSEAALQACKQHAQAVVAAGRDKAQAIAEQANARISKLRASYLQAVEKRIAALSPAAIVDGSSRDILALTRAAQRVAARLASDEDDRTR